MGFIDQIHLNFKIYNHVSFDFTFNFHKKAIASFFFRMEINKDVNQKRKSK